MLKINDNCMDSADWMEEVGFARPCDDVVTLEYLDDVRDECDGDDSCDYWDFPLSEIEELFETAKDMDDEDYELQLVRFADDFGGYEYRLCEI